MYCNMQQRVQNIAPSLSLTHSATVCIAAHSYTLLAFGLYMYSQLLDACLYLISLALTLLLYHIHVPLIRVNSVDSV